MLRVAIIALIVAVGCKVIFGRWPWQYLSAPQTSHRDLAEARTLLSVSKSADINAVIEAHRRLILRVHPDRGGSAGQVHEADAARDLLLSRLTDTPIKRDPR